MTWSWYLPVEGCVATLIHNKDPKVKGEYWDFYLCKKKDQAPAHLRLSLFSTIMLF